MADEPFDLDALVSERTPFHFRFGGEDYTLPAALDIRAAVALDEGRPTDALELLLGTEQWQRMMNSSAVLDDEKFRVLVEKYMAHMGTTLGESPASSRSSRRTAGPSKQRSKPTTALR